MIWKQLASMSTRVLTYLVGSARLAETLETLVWLEMAPAAGVWDGQCRNLHSYLNLDSVFNGALFFLYSLGLGVQAADAEFCAKVLMAVLPQLKKLGLLNSRRGIESATRVKAKTRKYLLAIGACIEDLDVEVFFMISNTWLWNYVSDSTEGGFTGERLQELFLKWECAHIWSVVRCAAPSSVTPVVGGNTTGMQTLGIA